MVDTKISDLTSLTASAGEDLLAIVDDPGGTPVTKKISIEDLFDVTFTNANTGIDFDNFSLTGSNATSFVNLTGTWNTTGTPTAIKLNITDTASNASSLLMDLQVGGSSKFRVTKSGGLILDGTIAPNDYSNINVEFGNGQFLVKRTDTAGSYFSVTATSRTVQVAANSMFGWSGTNDSAPSVADVSLYRDAANTLALRNSTNAQTFNVYNTYTDASNYERGFIRYNSNVFEIGHQAAGTGTTSRSMRIILGSFTNEFSGTTGELSLAGGLKQIGANSYHQMGEMTSAPTGVANRATIYAEDNGAGKTRLMVVFGSGAAQQIAIEP